jgi:hypothetical protein
MKLSSNTLVFAASIVAGASVNRLALDLAVGDMLLMAGGWKLQTMMAGRTIATTQTPTT